ncbi:hypothetical protein B0T10DRAFT_399448 [Thelonectria olida]|uniref:Uncharacterized protein n=1 Tax=Thelonectria olida TaxID=1576542 RepID=A0A9P9ATL0_9HYPO|nr:hypothetical protein B0T10DRAFT_399448 [Thelonectria olida]
MNRFRGRKKAKDDLAAAPRPSVESESSGPFKMFGKNKKSQEEEPKPELDLASALPSSDDFRTSLLMTGLSARFSMLREQDDPNTKVGKASDDSVLYPKRQSRLMDFGFGGGLSDIAEVESIRAPFARNSAYNSDDAASINGSVMTRSKPTEGNNLFGGRQKIYKISGAGGKPGATSGRALYGDDVAQSAFQKYRQAERAKEIENLEELRQSDSLDSEPVRPDSPQSEYNRRRETSSTNSSVPSQARNSTAATSITSSQPAQSVKEWQSATAASNPTPPIERSVTRTRRLYEQGLNQDLHNSQTSALSRIDTLSKQRNINRTPDLTPTVPSPSSATFSDRFANTRSILNKASAPNLRSFSPPTTISSQTTPLESQNRFTGFEERASFGATPPLSPPISDAGEHQALSFPPEKTKLAATSVLAKAAQYDDSRYAQRQIQLQRGRETTPNRFRADSNTSGPTIRSRSPSTQRTVFEKHDSNSFSLQAALKEEGQTSTFFDDEEEDDNLSDGVPTRTGMPQPPQVTVERPADQDHPAFRKSALPTPLSLEKDDSKSESPEDSPTLGPTSGGLSGLVRAHLRQDSNASSIYDNAPNDSDLTSRFPPERDDVPAYESVNNKTNTWESIERGVEMSMDNDLPSPTMTRSSVDAREVVPVAPASAHDSKISLEHEKETDDFARHLADGARRVRERLTSYVESDSGSSIPPPPPVSELPPPPRPNALGILKAKSSRGSLVDRTRGDQSQTKAKKLLGLSGSASSTSLPIARPDSLTDNEMKQEQAQVPADAAGNDGRPSMERENVHAGLKAFRQARRELQRMKEIEVQQRYQAPQQPPPQRAPSLRGPPSRQASQERRPPPVSYNRMPSEESWNGNSSRSASRATSERERSGSENSNSGRSGSRPPRLRNGSIPRDEFYAPMPSPGPNGVPRQGPMMRSPSHPRPSGTASPVRLNRFGEPSPNLNRGFDHGQPSPVSPMNGGPSPYGPPSQRSFPQHPGNMDFDHSAKRMMRPRDPSDPPLLSPNSQGPMGQRGGISPSMHGTMSSNQNGNMNGNMSAPPLPPINPRRKTNPMNDFARRSEDEAAMRGRFPISPVSGDESRGGHGAFASDDEGPAQYRQRLRKATSEANGMNARARSLRNSPPHPSMPPPMPPSMSGNSMPGGMI